MSRFLLWMHGQQSRKLSSWFLRVSVRNSSHLHGRLNRTRTLTQEQNQDRSVMITRKKITPKSISRFSSMGQRKWKAEDYETLESINPKIILLENPSYWRWFWSTCYKKLKFNRKNFIGRDLPVGGFGFWSFWSAIRERERSNRTEESGEMKILV